MGLDIRVYERIEQLPDDFKLLIGLGEDQWDVMEEAGIFRPHLWDGFPASHNGLTGGWYRSIGENWSFRAGSYGNYGVFRENLAKMVGLTCEEVWADPAAFADCHFFELINFADNEGTIGPVACEALADDFLRWTVVANDALDKYDYEKYEEWSRAFTAAAGTGCLDFR